MSYIPPHKRLQTPAIALAAPTDKSIGDVPLNLRPHVIRSASEAIPDSTSNAQAPTCKIGYVPPHRRPPPPNLRPHRVNKRVLRSASHIGLLYVSAEAGSILELVPFTGTTFSHLNGLLLYTLRIHGHPETHEKKQQSVIDACNIFPPNILGRMYPELYEAIWQQGRVENGIPTLSVKFGKIILHGRQGSPFRCILSQDDLEEPRIDLKHTFDNGLDVGIFEDLKQMYLKKNDEVTDRESFVILVERRNELNRDKRRLRLICERKDADGSKLILKRIKPEPLRHFAADVCRVGHELDMRVMLVTRSPVQNLTEDELNAFHRLVHDAVIKENVKGGLDWPMGCTKSSEHFEISGLWHRRETVMDDAGKQWKFRSVNRYDLQASTTRLMYEIKVKVSQWPQSFEKVKEKWRFSTSTSFPKEGNAEVDLIIKGLKGILDEGWLVTC